MKLKIEISPGCEEEIIIRAPEANEKIQRLRRLIEDELGRAGELTLHDAGKEYYLPYSEILFFEANAGKVYAHTDKAFYVCQMSLTELCGVLPRSFARASKSCLINTAAVYSVRRSPTGIGEVEFISGKKKVYISRMYYKTVKEIIEETRLKK